MHPVIIMIIAAVAVVGLFVVGMSITLIVKGHHIQSEIGDNPHMQKLGIRCALRESVAEERALRGADACFPGVGCPGTSLPDEGCEGCSL